MFAKFMNKKDFHPGSKANIKRVWMAEQKLLAAQQKEKELELQYNKEQERFKNRQAISNDDRIKSGLDFLYDAPPGFNKGKLVEEQEGEVKFEWQRGAPREAYAKSLGIEARDQPFGIAVRNVKCIRCGKWGHINTDRECPLFNKSKNANVDPSLITDIADPMRLLKDMQTEGLTLKQNVLGRVFDPYDPNQQIVASDNDDEDDAEAVFLASLTDKQKKKLLRKLDRLEQEEIEAQSGHKKHKKKKRKRSSESRTVKHDKESDSSDSEPRKSKKPKKKAKKRKSGESDESDSTSDDQVETDQMQGRKYPRESHDRTLDRHHSETHTHSIKKDRHKDYHDRKTLSRDDKKLRHSEKDKDSPKKQRHYKERDGKEMR
ncbi:corepressor interacting with RBPJ 1-like [Montipora capricornis]|uniref:corepressor interacting with RBPJ 1-like n=1 Tax=Montipora capricornis TaxID=246305 RepID=UPI0035F178A7